ncbi:MAG: hypothetical protein WC619_02500 [Patescibacteria group bacterium]
MLGETLGLLGVVNGSLSLGIERLLRMCGIPVPEDKGRKYLFRGKEFFPFDGIWIARPQDMPEAVLQGKVVAGFSGEDWIAESGLSGFSIPALFPFSKGRMEAAQIVVLGKPGQEFEDTRKVTVYTEYPRLARLRYRKAKIVRVYGAAEAWVVIGEEKDVAVDLFDLGSTAAANDLVRIGDPIMVSRAAFFAREDSPSLPKITAFARKLQEAFARLANKQGG